MDLATFGAILSFAMDFEEQAARFYAAAAQGVFEDVFADLETSSRKRASRMERTRREGVAEMILEPITGLIGDDYVAEAFVNPDESLSIEQAIALEDTASRFYLDAAEKLPIREVVRIFTRMAKENEKRKAQLETLRLGK